MKLVKSRMCIGRCEICGLRVGTAEGKSFPFHRDVNGFGVRRDHAPKLRSVWRVKGVFGPRDDGRRYYTFEQASPDKPRLGVGVDFTRLYKWDRRFWYGTDFAYQMSQVRPGF